MPPSCCGRSSGDCATAQRTSRNSATTGILRKTISQMNVQISTPFDRIPGASSVQPRIRAPGRLAAGRARSAAELERSAAELRHRVQLLDPRDDLAAAEALHSLGPELLDV